MNLYRRLSLVALLLAHLVPLLGCLLWGWDAGHLVLLFWFENVVIGGYNVIKMLSLPGGGNPIKHGGKLFLVPFFMLHYGGFCAVHGMFVILLSSGGLGSSSGNVAKTLGMNDVWGWGPLVFVGLFIQVVRHAWDMLGPEGVWGVWALVTSHGISLMLHYFLGGENQRATLSGLMMAPYARIVVLHIAIIAAAVPVMMMGSPVALLTLLVIGKVLLDAHLHLKSHRDTPGQTDHSPVP
ncbi:MAG: DUF6498-containing protein [Candidatus Methylacidiphilales bacterium]